MKTDRMDRRTAEWLLDGPTDAGPADAGPLVLLLGALRAAPRPGEFAGEAAAVAAYRRALAGHPGPVPATEPAGAYQPFEDMIAAAVEHPAPLLVALDGVTDPR
ncbi:hypothetical protein, partial [Micromonospora globbae]|uniref:hypothetical protein n=1 Tax=Micromonospora globbae TaxID=1894969 RepID=UPI0034222B2C